MSDRNKKQRLGRGLGALLGQDYLAPSMDDVDVRTIPLGSISANPLQPRKTFTEDELAGLTRSIQENGLLQPLVVRPDPARPSERFQLVAGERRFRALRDLGRDQVAVVVRDVDDQTLLVLALVENIQREQLNPLDEALGYEALVGEFGLTQQEIAQAVGKDRSTVANSLRLLKLPGSLRTLVQEGGLSMGHARALLSISDPGRMVELGRHAAREGWSVREVEARARAADSSVRGTKPTARASREDPAAGIFQEALREALGSRVQLKARRNGSGTVEIPFRSAEDFERVFHLLTGREASDVGG